MMNSSFESTAASSEAPSQEESQEDQVFLTETRVPNKQLPFAQMRGVIHLHAHFFEKGKRYSKVEKEKRWNAYKAKIMREYGRVIRGKFQSEKALVQRYSNPLKFLKYRLKRVTKLKVADLSAEDREWYYEIGGLDNVEQLFTNQINIDSVEHAKRRFESLQQDRQRRRLNPLVPDSQSHNHNQHAPAAPAVPPPAGMNLPNLNLAQTGSYDDPLNRLQSDLDLHETALLEKKKVEIFAVTQQKMAGMKKSIEAQFLNEPHSIGSIPGLKNQRELAFNCWLKQFKVVMLSDPSVKLTPHQLSTKIIKLQRDPATWNAFLSEWILVRIVHDDDFTVVWGMLKEKLYVPGRQGPSSPISLVQFDEEAEKEEKEELLGNSKEPMDEE